MILSYRLPSALVVLKRMGRTKREDNYEPQVGDPAADDIFVQG